MSSEHDPSERETSEQEPSGQETSGQETSGQETSGQEFDDAQAADAASQSQLQDKTAEGDAMDGDPAGKLAMDGDPAGKPAMDGDPAEGSDPFGAGIGASPTVESEPAQNDGPAGEALVESGATDQPGVRGAPDEDQREDAGDADSITDDGESESAEKVTDWDRATSAHRIAVELKRIESGVRGLLEHRDPRRKRRLTGTRRWLELQEDIIAWYGADRFDVETLRELQRLVTRRHHLFRRLRYIASTRSGWNT